MPTYDYRCDTCGINFEMAQSFHDDALAKCPTKKSGQSPADCASAGRGRVVRVFSAPGISFKGSGFYKTDSRKSASASTGNGDSSSSSSTTSDKAKPEKSSSDTKSASTTTSKTATTKTSSSD